MTWNVPASQPVSPPVSQPASPTTPAPFWHWLGRQLHQPEGGGGAWIGRAMALANTQPNRLALAALDAQPGDKVLELGFGPGAALAELQSAVGTQAGAGVVGLDPSQVMLGQAKRRNRRAVADGRMALHQAGLDAVEALGYGAGSFDKVLGVNVAYFFDQDGRDVAAIRRLLKPGGRMVLFVTDQATMQHWQFAQGSHHRLWSAADLAAILARAGFERDGIDIRRYTLPFGIKGLLAIGEQARQAQQDQQPAA